MGIIGKGKETYLYLNGIRPSEATDLSDGVMLLPASCNPDPDDIISKSPSEIDIGVACIFLRSVSACFHITADVPKNLAIRAWNSQWDAILLSALHDCEIGHTFQAEVPPESFTKAKDFHVTNYAFKGLSSGKSKKVTPAKHRWITNHYKSAKALLDNDRYRNAVHCLSSYRWHSMPRAQLALVWSGIEGLFNVDYELSFRLSLYTAKFLAPKVRARQKVLFESTKKLYTIRSKAVHGGKLKNTGTAVEESVALLRKLIIKCAENKSLPKVDKLAP
ncbi:MAG: hypothetical protein GY777_30390 [Candidatus Brocadiaceae bacterium]|nr:hypothetical protein [Candidatus Brocadiaceae bacterium]